MASLLDVFNASARLASQGLDMYSREQKYHLDTELYKQAQDYELLQNRLAQDLTRVDASGEFPFLNKPDEYRRYVEKSLAQWKQNAVRAGNGSRYYIDNLDRIALQGQTALGKKIYAAEQAAERERYAVDVQRNLAAVNNEPYSEEAVAKALAIVNAAEQNNFGGALDIEKLRQEEIDTLWSKAGVLQVLPETTDDGAAAVTNQLEGLERDLRENHGIDPDEYIENKQRKIGEARQGAVLQIQSRNYTNLEIENNEYRQMLRDYLENAPEAPTYPQVVDAFLKGRAEVNAGTEGNRQSEYANDKKPAMKSMFPWDERLGAEPGGGSKKEPSITDVRDALQRMADNTIRGEYGDASLTTMMASPQARGKAVDMVMQELRDLGYTVGVSPYDFYREYSGAFDDITKIAVDRVTEFSPAIGFAIEGAAKWLEDGFKPDGILTRGLDESQQRIVQGYATEMMVNAMLDNVFTVNNENEVVKRITEIKALVAAGKMEALSRRGMESYDEYLGRRMQRYYNPDNVIINDKGQIKTNPLINEEEIADIEGKMRTQVLEYLADYYETTVEQAAGSLSPAEPILQEDDQGVSDIDLSGAYRFGGERFRAYPKDNTYEIQKYNEETGAWEKAPGRSGDSGENMRARQNEYNNAVRRNNRQETANQREANNLANIMYRGESLPLPNLSGRNADDPMTRERAILQYGIDEYLDWLRNNYPDIYTSIPALNNRGEK